MKLKSSEARNDINKLQENLEIEIDSFIFQLDLIMKKNPFLIDERTCFSAIKHHYDNDIFNLLKDEQLVDDIKKTCSSDMTNMFKFSKMDEEEQFEIMKVIDIDKVALRFQLSSLCDSNISKISRLYLIKQFNQIEFLSYALGHSHFSEYFNIDKIKEKINKKDYYNQHNHLLEKKIEVCHLFEALQLFTCDYKYFLTNECGHKNENLTSNTIESISKNPMKIVLDSLYEKSKSTLDVCNLINRF